MDAAQKHVAQKFFKLKILESKGTAFQDLFERVMEKSELEFRKVKPYGKEGDHKNDGFVPSKGIYYQVYAPESPEEKDATASKKVVVDFKGLVAYWDGKFEVKEFYFVFNDAYKGKSPLLYAAVSEIQADNPAIAIGIFYCSDLQRIFLELSEININDIIGYIPDAAAFDVVEIDALTDVAQYLTENEEPVTYENSLKLPDFKEKIQFNDLSDPTSSLLTQGSYQIHVLDQFFAENPNLKELLQHIFTGLYKKALEYIEEGTDERGDLAFFYILEKAKQNGSKRIYEAALALMACFFETCDIFEEPI